jgi:flagellin-like protein
MEDEGAGNGSKTATFRLNHRRNRKGVSDIIGTILILAITVVLFSSIFFFVSNLPGPTPQSTSQFAASLGVSAGKTEAYINVSYTTGPLLSGTVIAIYLTSSLHNSNFNCARTATAGDPYTIGDGLGGAKTWSASQTWSLHLGPSSGAAPVTICGANTTAANLLSTGDQITITIVNLDQNNLVIFQVTIPGTVSTVPPQFIAEGISPSPVQGTGPFYLWAQIKSSIGVNNSNTVYANLTNIPIGLNGPAGLSGACLRSSHSPPPRQGCLIPMTYNGSTGDYCTFNSCLPTIYVNSTLSGTYPITINATDKIGQANSVVVNAQFLTSTGAVLLLTDAASPGSPYVGQNTTVSLTITDDSSVGGLVTVTFHANYGSFCASQRTCASALSFTITNVNAPPNNYNTVYAFWTAGAVNGGTGQATITIGVTGLFIQSPASPLVLTVLPRTLLVDGTGIASGSIAPLDTFTYLTSDFESAGLADPPDVVTVADSPMTTAASYVPGAKNCIAAMVQTNATSNLACYDVIIWDAGNYTSAGSGLSCISSADASAIQTAVQDKRSVWVIGGDAFSSGCASSSTLASVFGLTINTATASLTNSSRLGISTAALPTVGILGTNLYLGASAYYTSLTTSSACAHSYLRMGVNANGNILASYCSSASQGNAFATSFDLSALSEAVPPPSGTVQVSTSQQTSLVYDVFDWLANLTTGPANNRLSPDWGISQVVVTPSPASFKTPTSVFISVRNNGAYNVGFPGIEVQLTIGGQVYTSAAPFYVNSTAMPAEGGSYDGMITWYPTVIGYVSVGACLTLALPSNDSVSGNNCMGNSLFNVQLYVHYSVLLVDDTLHNLAPATLPDTTPMVLNAMLAAQHPLSTITTITITTACGTAVLPNNQVWTSFNIVVWNEGSVVNASGRCPLSDANAALLTTFLSNGGARASVLIIGQGLLTDTSDAAVKTFASDYLGVTIGATAPTTATSPKLYGVTGDALGNGMAITYPASTGNYTFCTVTIGTQGATASAALYFGAADYWTPWNTALTLPSGIGCTAATPPIAAIDAYGGISGGWHSAYWGFSLAASGDSAQVNLLMLRTSTFFGRLLPTTDTIVAPPDITFATVTTPWTNFDGMHPQLDQQYLIQANVTNLGANLASNVGISVYDGSHILGSQTLTIGGAVSNASGITYYGVGQLSVSWTPLYGSSNPITVKITSSTVGEVLPGTDSAATWNVTVYFFYDSTSNNVNQWTHNDMTMWEDAENPNCGSPPVAQQIYFSDDINIPDEWPLSDQSSSTGHCPPKSGSYTAYAADTWGMDFSDCYLNLWVCGSLAVKDDVSNSNSVVWGYTSSFNVPAGVTSAYATWFQTYNLAPYQSGGVICVTTTTCPTTPLGSSIYTPTPGYTGSLEYSSGTCKVLSAFTGSNSGNVKSWTPETLNLTKFIGQTVTVGFGFVEAASPTACGGSSVAVSQGWWIDQFSVYVSGGSLTPVAENFNQAGANCPQFTSTTTIPTDTWHLVNSLPSGFTTTPATIPTGGAWSVAANYAATSSLTLNPNMWDLLQTRAIDLSNAANATLTFNYLWSYISPAMDPPQGLVVEVTPVLANGVTNWVQVWQANMPNGTVLTTNFNTHWYGATISLAGYVGEVVRVGFLVGSNCGGDGDDDAEYDYPTEATPSSGITNCNLQSSACDPGPGATAALISGVYIGGATTITPFNTQAPHSVPVASFGKISDSRLISGSTVQSTTPHTIVELSQATFKYTTVSSTSMTFEENVSALGGTPFLAAAVWVVGKEKEP